MSNTYIITGPLATIDGWAKCADELGVLACIEKGFRNTCCSRNQCGILDGRVGLEVLGITDSDAFTGEPAEAAILLTRKPRSHKEGDEMEVRKLVSRLVEKLGSDAVKCFESAESGKWNLVSTS